MSKLIWLMWLVASALSVEKCKALALDNWAAHLVENVVLTGGQGVRWEPSEGEWALLEPALTQTPARVFLLKAPFDDPDDPRVTTQTLGWTLLALLERAGQLRAEDSARALVLVYLASQQVGFARDRLWDAQRRQFAAEWDEASQTASTVFVEADQVVMLWALSSYSRVGSEVIVTTPEQAQAFVRYTIPLADEVFKGLVLRRFDPQGATETSSGLSALWDEALEAYLGVALDSALKQEAALQRQRLAVSQAPSASQRAPELLEGVFDVGEWAKLLTAWDRQRHQGQAPAALSDYERALNHPPVGALLASCAPCQALLEDSETAPVPLQLALGQTGLWMQAAFRALRLGDSASASTPPPPAEIDSPALDSLIDALNRISQKLAGVTQESDPPLAPEVAVRERPTDPPVWPLAVLAGLSVAAVGGALWWRRHLTR